MSNCWISNLGKLPMSWAQYFTSSRKKKRKMKTVWSKSLPNALRWKTNYSKSIKHSRNIFPPDSKKDCSQLKKNLRKCSRWPVVLIIKWGEITFCRIMLTLSLTRLLSPTSTTLTWSRAASNLTIKDQPRLSRIWVMEVVSLSFLS